MKTRIFALGLAVLLVFTMLAGCSGGNSGAGSCLLYTSDAADE